MTDRSAHEIAKELLELCGDMVATIASLREAAERLEALTAQIHENDQESVPKDAEQDLVSKLSPGYRGLDENGDSKTLYDEGWNDALDEHAKRVRSYFRESAAKRRAGARLRVLAMTAVPVT